eukprot:TRINITY_DN592_c0_g1_i1.p1 TRINITY_DN592_c0_g1~~TRINITY_DN592_c0_g1_i1.p1  ORF type:complete len:222 (-),score=32.45 TRINITY_DN592_c0_g1_i1:132-797(-)
MAMASCLGVSGSLGVSFFNKNIKPIGKSASFSVAGRPLLAQSFRICTSSSKKRNEMLLVKMCAAEAVEVNVDEMDRVALRKYLKQRLPGGIAAQELIGTGYKKRAIARVVLLPGTGKAFINGRTAQDYLQGNPLWLQYLKIPLVSLGLENTYDVIVKAQGGGLSSQAQASLLGIARALCKANPENRVPLKSRGLLTRDTRIVESKKTGLKKARKAPQYSKR